MKAYNILCRAVHLANVLKSTHNGSDRDISIRCKKGRMPRPEEYKDEKFSIGIVQEKIHNLSNFSASNMDDKQQFIPAGLPAYLLHVENNSYTKEKAAENVTVEVIARLIVDLEQARFKVNEKEDVIENKNQAIHKLKDVRLNDGHHALNQLRCCYHDLFVILQEDVKLAMKRNSPVKANVLEKFSKISESFPDPYVPDEDYANDLIKEFTVEI